MVQVFRGELNQCALLRSESDMFYARLLKRVTQQRLQSRRQGPRTRRLETQAEALLLRPASRN